MEIDFIPNLRDAFVIGWTLVVSGLAICWADDHRSDSVGPALFVFGILLLFPMYCMWLGSYWKFGM